MDKKFGKLLIILVFFWCSFHSYGQQEALYTQYMFNGLAINPAYAGSQEHLTITALAREQWTGLDGAPSTQTLSVHTRIKNKKIGLGFLVINDRIAVTRETGFYGIYSYRVEFDNNASLSLGLQLGVSSFRGEFSKLNTNPNLGNGGGIDPSFNENDISNGIFNFGTGIYYSTDRYYLGFSIPHIITNEIDKDNVNSSAELSRHYFLTAGYLLDLNENLKLKPNLLVKMVGGAPVQFDINANLLIKEKVWAGLSWRSLDSFDVLFELRVTDQFSFGYSYDFATTTDLRRVNSGSHEFMLRYQFGSKSQGEEYSPPRFF